MQIVIDIPEDLYEGIERRDGALETEYVCDELMKAVDNGTPLPKGHEKLIAEPTEEDIAKTVGGKNDFAECIRDAVKAVFDNAPTIIEADRRREK
jgi:hypothetical protein